MLNQFRSNLAAAALLLTGVLAAFAQQGGPPPQPGPPPQLVKVKDDLYIVQNQANNMADLIGYGGNASIFLTNDGVILIDSKSDREHDDLVAKVKSLTDKPVKYVILTHNHADHSGGVPKMEAMGARVIISAADRDNMLRGKQAGAPDFGYIGRANFRLGGKDVQLYQYRGHTRGDTVVYFPADRVIILGDLLTTAETIPMIVSYPDGGTWTDWRNSIDDILRMDFDNAIPGHGPMVTKAQVAELRNKMGAIMERIRALNREKKSQQEIADTVVKEFNWGFGPSAGNIAGMMQELR